MYPWFELSGTGQFDASRASTWKIADGNEMTAPGIPEMKFQASILNCLLKINSILIE
jgi:hypothetical protein